MTEPGAPRVVLLAREGEARDRLGEALAQAGAEVALVADPVSADPGEAVASKPQAVLVALEPAIEDALERYDALLSDPGIAVIFEEAELAAQRTGWDAARWVRHLAAKLHRHDDVLPPGADAGDDFQPSPGPLPPPRDATGLDIATFTDEAQQLADEVPRDQGLEPDVRLDGFADDLSLADDAPADEAPPEPGYDVADGLPPDAEMDAAADNSLSEDTLTLEALPDDDAELSFLAGDDADDDAQDATASLAPGDTADYGGGIELVDVDALLASVESLETGARDASPAATPPTPGVDLEALEARISALSLADVDSYGHGPERGAVLVEGGLGGPDAVRQLLAAIPEGFPRPVLVRLQLDGGRYDRLVKQMARAAQLPVALAEAGHEAEAGTVYFVPPDISLQRGGAGLVFVADEDGSRSLLDVLPARDSALLLLSGSSLDSVDAGMTGAASGLLVAGQSLDGCYDATASTALIARGAGTGLPADLAAQLAERWPPQG